MPGQVRHSQWPLPEGCAAPCSIRGWLCVTWSRNSPASAIPCKVQRCGRCRLPARLCPAGSPGSSHRFPYPGSASTGHTLPTGRRGERVSAWLLAGAFVMINWALPFKGRKESLCRWAPNTQISLSWSAPIPIRKAAHPGLLSTTFIFKAGFSSSWSRWSEAAKGTRPTETVARSAAGIKAVRSNWYQ